MEPVPVYELLRPFFFFFSLWELQSNLGPRVLQIIQRLPSGRDFFLNSVFRI